MFADRWLVALNPQGKNALVLATGGGADIVLAQFVAQRLVSLGAIRVDIAQALNKSDFTDEIVCQFHLTDPQGTGQGLVRRLPGGKPNDGEPGTRGNGISMAAAMEWNEGDCLLVAAKKGSLGAAALARREWEPTKPYDLAVAVDGGGDILTGGPEEFDRVVLDVFQTVWDKTRPLALLVVGLGADGHIWSPEKASEMEGSN